MTILWLALALAELAALALAVFIYRRNRSMKQRQDALVKELRGQRYWRVNLARPGFMDRWLRFSPFEAKGVLVDEGDSFRLRGIWAETGKAFDSLLAKKEVQIEWLGNNSLKTGNIYWARLRSARGTVHFSADTGWNALASREALSDIFRSAFPHCVLEEATAYDFALEKNPRSLVAMAVFFSLMLFSLLDSFVFSGFDLTDAQIASLLRSPIVAMSATAGVIALAALSYRFFTAGRVPSRESMALACMLAAVTAASTLPVLKRVDQLLAAAPSQPYTYRLSGAIGHLEPVDLSLRLPPLKFPRMKEYWQQLPPGSEYTVPFLRGPLGLWQLDHAKFDPPIIAFYEKQQGGTSKR